MSQCDQQKHLFPWSSLENRHNPSKCICVLDLPHNYGHHVFFVSKFIVIKYIPTSHSYSSDWSSTVGHGVTTDPDALRWHRRTSQGILFRLEPKTARGAESSLFPETEPVRKILISLFLWLLLYTVWIWKPLQTPFSTVNQSCSGFCLLLLANYMLADPCLQRHDWSKPLWRERMRNHGFEVRLEIMNPKSGLWD